MSNYPHEATKEPDMRVRLYGRHGETYDLLNGFRSRWDTELTPTGEEQMKSTGELLRRLGVQPDLMVCSLLPRAKRSADLVAEKLGYDKDYILREGLLNERCCGVAEGMRHDEIKARWPDGYDTVPGAETLEQLQERANRAATWLYELDAKVVLTIAHGTLGRAIARAFAGRPYTDEFSPDRISFGRAQVMRVYPLPVTALTP